MSKLRRKTGETEIVVGVKPGTGASSVSVRTTDGDGFRDERFFRHMLETLARYSGLDIEVEATGDLRHHLIEDVAIALGKALADEVPASATRFGEALIPMDEALAQAAIDVGGRPYYVGKLPSSLYTHFLHSFATNLDATLHVRVLRGSDKHHMVEAAIKATGLALRKAMEAGATQPDGAAVFSTKGTVVWEKLD